MELGGFDPRYRPGYYEDVDYCFKLRDHGYRVYFQPESAVVHREGGTGGTDLSQGVKRYQTINQARFAECWGNALRHQPAPPMKMDESTLQALVIRGAREFVEGTS